MHVNVFCYGTLRTDPRVTEIMDCSDAELSRYGQLDMQLHWDPDAEIVGSLGGWRLPNRSIFCDGKAGDGVPAVTDHDTDDCVIGDLYRVSLTGFASILKYEGWPSLYEYEVLHVTSVGKLGVIEDAVVFTTSRAEQFGRLLPTGDYFAPRHQEVQCAE